MYIFSPECKNETILAPIIKTIRLSWYAAFASLIGSVSKTSGDIIVEREKYHIAPLFVKKLSNGRIAVIRRLFDRCDKNIPDFITKNIELFNITKKTDEKWGVWEDVPYVIQADKFETNYGLYSFGCTMMGWDSYHWPRFDLLVSYFLRHYKEKEKPDTVMTAIELWEKLETDYYWKKYNFKETIEQARKNTREKGNKEDPEKLKEQNNNLFSNNSNFNNNYLKKDNEAKSRIRLGLPEHVESCRLVVRALATLEMILKDPKADIVVRRCKREDFVAALKLIEKVMLPTYFNIIFEHDLFDNYAQVKPLISFVDDGWK